MLKRLFTDHPQSVGETYLEHARNAGLFAAMLLRASLAAGIHAVFPWLYQSTASRSVAELHHRMVISRSRARRRSEPLAPYAESADFVAEYI